MTFRNGTRRALSVLVSFVAMAMAATVLPLAAAAQVPPQHELLIGVDFDGTPGFSAADPADDGLGGHTPGEDLNANNNVLRTNDQIQYNMNWNVNEGDATGVTIRASLPPNMEWLPDATTVTGVPGGCTDDGTSSINLPNPGDLVCIIDGDQVQGSNGAIHPRALLKGELDGVVLSLTGTIESNENPTPVDSNTLETTVSAVPRGNWIKGKPIRDAVSRAIIGYEPDEKYFGVFDEFGVEGQLFVWNLRLIPTGGLKGAEPINDAVPIQFFDHFFDTVPTARLATPAMMPTNNLGQARVPCGGYDGDGAYPYGQTVGAANATPPAQTNIGLWECTDISAGYPMVQIDISGHDTQNIATTNADLGPNGGVLASGQIAFWAPRSDLIAKAGDPQIIVNAISGTTDAIAPGTTTVTPIQIAGTNGPVDENTADGGGGLAGLSNDSPYEYGTTPPSEPGRAFRHSIAYKNGPYQEKEFQDYTGKTYREYDDETETRGGTGYFVTNGISTSNGSWSRHWDGNGQTPRGNVLSVTYKLMTTTSSPNPPVVHNEPIHACVAIDTTHQEVVGLPPSFPVVIHDVFAGSGEQNTYVSYARPVIGGASDTPASLVANVIAGKQSATYSFPGIAWYGGIVVDRGELDYVIEVAGGVNPGNGQNLNAVSCNGDDAAWVDATGDLSGFQTGTMTDGTPIYGGITHMRVITSGDVPWAGNVRAGSSWGSGLELNFQVRVKDDPSPGFQEAQQELIIYGARASGVWDGTGQPPTPLCTNAPRWNQELAGSDATPASGWCNLPFVDDGATSSTVGDQFNEYDNRAAEWINAGNGYTYAAHVDKVFIVEAALALSKQNLGGTSQIVSNGNIVEFAVNPSVVGSSLDEIDNVVVTDTLPATMAFQGFTLNPTVGTCAHSGGSPAVDPLDPTATITVGGTITCTYGDDYAGGWGLQDEGLFQFEAMIVGASADSTLTNTATITGNDSNTGDPKKAATGRASVFTGAPFDESVIVKAIDTGVGDCTDYPAGPVDAAALDPQPADWADRCEMIVFEDAPASATSTMGFTLEMANQGNTPLTNVRFVDVFPHNADEVEPISNTGADGVPVSTLGDGRSPETDTAGTLSLDSFTGDIASYWVTGDAPNTISRDPDYATLNTTWCTPAGAYAAGPAGACPAAGAETGIYAFMDDIVVGGKITARLDLETVDHECDDIWTNTFGARVDQIGLPVRSNDVSIMVDCKFDLALRKLVDPAWVPGTDWLTPGTSTVDFMIEFINQGDAINNFEITDYVDPAMFTFDIADNLGGNSADALALPYTWDASGANPVVTVNDPAHPLHDPNSNLIPNTTVIQIPVTLTIAAGFTGTDLDNYAEISYFDNDADPTNGDSASGDVVDEDSLPDDSNGDALVDDDIDSDITAGGPDEDDHDIASVPIYDLAIDKAAVAINQNGAGDWIAGFEITVTNDGNQDAFNIEVLETPPAGLTYQGSNAAAVGITNADPLYTIPTLAAGDSVTFGIKYLVTDLTAGPYVNSVQIDSFEDGAGGNPPDADSTPGNDDDHSSDTGDANEDDDAIAEVNLPFDLALVKKPIVDDPAYTDILDGLQDGDEILFGIEVFNQLSTVEDFDIIDYLQPGWVFDPAAQPSPLFTLAGSGAAGGPVLPFTWTLSGADPVALVDGVLPAGESVVIQIVLTADIPNDPNQVLENFAEILRFDDDGDPTNGDSSDGTIEDIDSTPDGSNDDPNVDDEFNNAGGDEDDHDGALTVWYDVAIDKQIFDGTSCVDGPAEITVTTATVEYCVTVTNEGPTDLYNVNFADTPPAGLVFATTTLLPGTVTDLTGGAYEVPTLAPGASETVQIEYTVDVAAMTSGSLVNVAEVTEMYSDPAGTDPAEDVDSFTDETPDGDAPVEDDEDDEVVTIPFDLALTKTLGPIDGDLVTMYLTVENQSIGVETIDITDYIDASMWEWFNPALNPGAAVDGASTAAAAYGFSWFASDLWNPVATIAPVTAGDKFAFGETIVIPITLQIADDWVGPELDNTAEISDFDDDNDPDNGTGADGTLPEADSTPDGIDGNGPGGESFNSSDDETDEDGTDGGDEDDHDGVMIPIFDQALVKTLDPATVQPLAPGDPVTFFIEIFNQGNVDVTDPTVIDYVDPAMFGPFDPGVNAPGTSADALGLGYAWTASGNDGLLAVTGVIPAGESIIVPVTLRISFAPTATTLTNTAEITGGTPTDENGDEITDGNGDPLEDADSDADDTNDDPVVDDETDNAGGDEDDHDIAEVIVAVPAIDIEKFTNGVQSDAPVGEQIMAGDPVTWTYQVENTGTTALLDVTVNDSDPSVTVDCGGFSNVIAMLLPGDTATCEATGVAGVGPYENQADVSGTPAFPSDPDADPSDPDSWSDDPDDYTETGQDPVVDDDFSHYYGTDGGLELEKSTNGIDADEAPGVPLAVGDTVEWTYEVTNTSPVAMINSVVTDSVNGAAIDCGATANPPGSNTIGVLLPGETVTCTSTGVFTADAGQYMNDSTVAGDGVLPDFTDPAVDPDDPDTWNIDPNDESTYEDDGAPPYEAEDPSHYHALEGELELEKATNGVDSDTAPGQALVPGDPVTWTYTVTNNSNMVLIDVFVNDSDPAVNVDCGAGSNRIAVLAIGESVTCTAEGIVAAGDYMNDSDTSGTPAVEDPENPGTYEPSGHDDLSDDDPSHYTGTEPAIDIEKDTNGDQADDTIGPFVAPGGAVTWTYVVTNTGDMPLADATVSDSDPAVTIVCPTSGDNTIALLLPGASETCTATGTAELGLYENTADVSGDPVWPSEPAEDCCDPEDPASWPTDPADFEDSGHDDVVDEDDSHYHSHDGDIMIEKSTNGVDSDIAPGQVINPGDAVTWTYVVTNTSNTPMVNVTVSDSDPSVVVDCGAGSDTVAVIAPGATQICTAEGVAGSGPYNNVAEVEGTPGAEDPDNPGDFIPIPGEDPVTDDDPSNYTGVEPAIDIEKDTNGVQSDTGIGEFIAEGDAVTWTYVVTNTGDVPLANAVVSDSDPAVTVTCPTSGTDTIALLVPGATETCEATAPAGAVLGLYENTADVSGDPVWPSDPTEDCCDPDDPTSWPTDPDAFEDTGQDPVDDEDDSAYYSHDGDIMLEKSTNGTDADTAPGPIVGIGDPVTWTYTVVNTSATPLVNVSVTDDQGVFVDCTGTGSNIIAVLLPGASQQCTGEGIATEGGYTNTGSTSGTPGAENPDGSYDPIEGEDPVTDEDPSNYFGADPSIDIEKDTNGDQADDTIGPFVANGDPVTWTYVVTNTGDVPLVDATVTDSDPSVTIVCPTSGDNTIALMLPGEAVTCEATGTASDGLYENTADVTGNPVWPTDPSGDCCDPEDPASWPEDPADYTDTGDDDVDDADDSHYHSFEGGIELEKYTNGVDSDVAPGQVINPGDPVTWTYEVTNTGISPLVDVVVTDNDPSVNVDCGAGNDQIAVLMPGVTQICTAEGVATDGAYTNLGEASGTPGAEDPENPGSFDPIDGADPVSDDDPSNYSGVEPAIDIEKDTNGTQADTGIGDFIAEGDPVTWTYVVTNTGDVPLADSVVSDSDPAVTVVCATSGDDTIALLVPGATETCTATAPAGAELGLYENVADVSGTPVWPTDPTDGCCDPEDPASWPTDPDAFGETGQDDPTDDDASHYHSHDGDIMIEKSTNGIDSDIAPGQVIAPGDPVTWTYQVINTSNTPMVDVVVNDSDPTVLVDCGAGSNTVPVVMPGATHICTAEGVAGSGPYNNVADVAGTPGAEDPDNPGEFSAIPGEEPVTDDDPSNYTGVEPSIDIEKDTNGIDADTPVGPILAPGDAVTWTYVVTNTGDVPLANATVTDNDPAVTVVCPTSGDNTIALLVPGASETCEATGVAQVGIYQNIADVSGDPVWPTDPTDGCCDPEDPASWPTDPAEFGDTGQDPVVDDDPSHYLASDGEIAIEKATNGEDADVVPGPIVNPGDPVTWTYVVVNTSTTHLIDVAVTDNTGVFVDCGAGSNVIPSLAPGAQHECTADGIAIEGQYENIGSVTGTPADENPDGTFTAIPGADPVSDDDPSHYAGLVPGIDIEKDTNGDQADATQGPVLAPGDVVTWTYVVTNTGDVALTDVTVTDSDPAVSVVCPVTGDNTIGVMVPGEAVTCTAIGAADLGAYENIADVSGTPAQLDDPTADPTDPANYSPTGQDDVDDDDASHYIAIDPSVTIEKDTVGFDADTAPGPILTPGSPVTWTYVVTNDGTSPLVNLVVSDDQGVIVDCGDSGNSISLLLPGQTHVCTGTGAAADGAYTNTGAVTGDAAVADPDNPGNYITVDDADPVTDDDPSNHLGLVPSIDVEKLTNGDQADNTTGPLLAPGDAVTWTYIVTNDGEVPVTGVTVSDDDPAVTIVCPTSGDDTIALLVPGASETCEASGTAVIGEYENTASTTGTPAGPIDPTADCCDPADPASWPTDAADYEPTGQDDVADEDLSHYVAHDGDVMIQKDTNGDQADEVPGPIIAPGDPVTWRYVVTNTSNTPLVDLIVSDDQGEPVNCGDNSSSIALLLPGESTVCTAEGTATAGQYENLGSVTGKPAASDPTSPTGYAPIPGAEPATDDDPSHYLGATPALALEKATNGVDSDVAPGEKILEGDPVEWTYVVTNTGDIEVIDMVVTDDQGEAVDCGDGTNMIALLAPGDSHTCTAEGTAGEEPYANRGEVTGDAAYEDPANPGTFLKVPGEPELYAGDPSHYDGYPMVMDLALQKKLKPKTANVSFETFTIEVFNQGTVDAANIVVTDHLPVGLISVDETWTANGDGTHTYIIDGPIKPGDSMLIEFDVQVMAIGDHTNLAGIDAADALHPETGAPLDIDDIDSTVGDTTSDNVVDDVLDSTQGDEDDSDIASVSRQLGAPQPLPAPLGAGNTVPQQATNNTGNTGGAASGPSGPQASRDSGPLAYTGSDSQRLALIGSLLLLSGTCLVLGTRRRRRSDEGVDLDWENLDD